MWCRRQGLQAAPAKVAAPAEQLARIKSWQTKEAEHRKGDSADDHRPSFGGDIGVAVLPERERERCDYDGRRGAEQTRKALRAEQVSPMANRETTTSPGRKRIT
jgi:hypothetical protein